MSSWEEQKEPEEGGGRKDNFFFWQYHLISSAHKTVGSLHSDAGGIVIKNRSTETFVWLGLLFTFLPQAKKYLKFKICSNTNTHWNSLVQPCVNTLFS